MTLQSRMDVLPGAGGLSSLSREGYAFASTLKFEDWGNRVRSLDLPYRGPVRHSLRDELVVIGRILQAARRERVLLLNSSSGKFYPDVIACVLLGFVPRRLRPRIALMGDMWEPNGGLRGLIEKIVIRLADRAIDRYLVLSSEELTVFPRLWRVDPAKVDVCHYHFSVTDEEVAGEEPKCAGHVFAGGDNARDYGALIEAARRFPEQRFVLATRMVGRLNPPPNVRLGPVPHDEFIRLLRTARLVVVPIKQGLRRSVGQQTYLNSMYLGKPTIVAEGFAVRDHIDDGKDALVVDGSVEGYVRAIAWALDPHNGDQVAQMAQQGRAKARMFDKARMAECLYAKTAALIGKEA